jgi:hypothetical protein
MIDARVRTALSDDDVQAALEACGRAGLLVGGQALAFWARHYQVTPDGPLADAVTMDADFIGSRELAALLHSRLGPGWTMQVATLDDAGGQTAKLFATTPYGFKEIDILSAIVGLPTERIVARAVEGRLRTGMMVRVLHPLDVLESRLRNLQTLPSKRNPAGIAQAQLAIAVVRRFIGSMLGAGPIHRSVFESVKRVARLATDSKLAIVALEYNLDVLAAVPASDIPSTPFQTEMWPRVAAEMEHRRSQFRALQERRAEIAARRREPDQEPGQEPE